MAGCARGDSIVNLQAALYSANNHHDNGEYTAIKKIESPELYHDQLIQDQRLISNEDGMLDTIRSYNDTNQYIGDLTIDSSNHVHVGHVFNTIINGTVKTHEKKSESKAECAKKVVSKRPCQIYIVICSIIGALIILLLYLSDTSESFKSVLSGSVAPRSFCDIHQPRSKTSTNDIQVVIVNHTGGEQCYDVKSCCRRLLDIQQKNVNVERLPDIRYNFLIGSDGIIYEGRGFDTSNEISPRTIDVALIGDFTHQRTPDNMLDSIDTLILVGADQSRISFGNVSLICYDQIKDAVRNNSQLCKDISNSEHINMFYTNNTFEFADDRNLPIPC